MSGFLKISLVVVFFLTSSFALAQAPSGEVLIRTRAGTTHVGRILSETTKGYLLAGPTGTEVVEFTTIVEVRPLAPQPVPSATQPSPSTPPPPPVKVDAVHSEESHSTREGFHFGIGAGGLMLPAGPLGHFQAQFEFNFGRVAYRINANVGALVDFTQPYFIGSVDNLFHFNVTELYAFSAGLQAGVAFGPFQFVQLGVVIQPVVIKLGDQRQHQLSLTGALSVLSNVAYEVTYDRYLPTTYREVTFAGTPQAYIGYSYFF